MQVGMHDVMHDVIHDVIHLEQMTRILFQNA